MPTFSLHMNEYIVYVCPSGPLADQLDHYFARSKAMFGPNAAHHYMPHCTLTGFFHDRSSAVPRYIDALTAALDGARTLQPDPVVAILSVMLDPAFHALVLDSPWIKQVVADFAAHADSPTRTDALRLKDWLHLSLAYEFPPEQAPGLAALAEELVDIHAPVHWELRFYERHVDGSWTFHAEWPL